jgi:phosphatidylserine/phosphatidylglycerophosphate/cardiolipin synthase-like enzyme
MRFRIGPILRNAAPLGAEALLIDIGILDDKCSQDKGIIVDGQKTVVGSQNWSSDGTQINRDASLIFDDSEIATYYNEVFQFDWANLTKPIGVQEMAPMIAQPGEPTPVGMVRVPWDAWYG